MATISRPADIVAEFLRHRVTDPRTRYTAESDSFTATASQTVFTLTPTTGADLVRAIKTVTVAGTAQEKWQEYTMDLASKTVTLATGAALNDSVVITYSASGAGEEWVYPDKPIAKMGKAKFPRVSVRVINKTGDRAGPYTASMVNSVHFQVDVWTKEGYSKTVSGKRYEEQDLADYVGHLIEAAFINYVDDLYPKLYAYSELAFGQVPFDEVSQVFRHKQEFTLSGSNVGH